MINMIYSPILCHAFRVNPDLLPVPSAAGPAHDGGAGNKKGHGKNDSRTWLGGQRQLEFWDDKESQIDIM